MIVCVVHMIGMLTFSGLAFKSILFNKKTVAILITLNIT